MKTITINLADYDALVAKVIALEGDRSRLEHAIRGDNKVALCEWEEGDSKRNGQWLPVIAATARKRIDEDMFSEEEVEV